MSNEIQVHDGLKFSEYIYATFNDCYTAKEWLKAWPNFTELAYHLAQHFHTKGEFLIKRNPLNRNVDLPSNNLSKAVKIFVLAYALKVENYQVGNNAYRCKLPDSSIFYHFENATDAKYHVLISAWNLYVQILNTTLSGYFDPENSYISCNMARLENDVQKQGTCANCGKSGPLYLVHINIADAEKSEVCENCACKISIPRKFQANSLDELILTSIY